MSCALIFGPEFHYLDHLAPLCALLNIPLFVTDEEIARQAKDFYPDLKLIYTSSLELPEELSSNHQSVITCLPRPFVDEIFFLPQLKRRMQAIWCPHGNSDKGWTVPFMEGLKEEESLLVYGKRLEKFLEAKGVLDRHKQLFKVGNYRYTYYLKQRIFYDSLLSEKLPPFDGKTLLYAPTWQDAENSSSFPLVTETLIKNLPYGMRLLIKLHPHLYRQFPIEIEILKSLSHERVHWIEELPCIYPLLSKVDIYLGDMSSVGYDFLIFNRPMFFFKTLHQKESLYLSQCGPLIDPSLVNQIYTIIEAHLSESQEPWQTIRAQVYTEVFVL